MKQGKTRRHGWGRDKTSCFFVILSADIIFMQGKDGEMVSWHKFYFLKTFSSISQIIIKYNGVKNF